jgi:hypothetical protein
MPDQLPDTSLLQGLPRPPAYLARFNQLTKGFGWLLLQLGAFASAPFLTQIVFGIGPLWPEDPKRVCFFTSVCAWTTIVAAYMNFERVAATRSRTVNRQVLVAVISCLILYVALESFFVYDNLLGQKDPIVGGFVLTPDAQKLAHRWSETEILTNAEFVATKVWERWSVKAVELSMLLTWLAMFTSLPLYT